MTVPLDSANPTGGPYGRAKLRVFRGDEEIPSVPGTALAGLVDLYREAATERSFHIALLWPAAIRVLPLVHIFATAERWSLGDKQGVRGLLYPTKANTFFPLNHLFLGRTELLRFGRDLAELPSRENTLVTRSCRDKDPVLIKAGSFQELRPCVNEIFPHFERLSDTSDWESYADDLLENVLTRLRRHAEKGALRAQLAALGNPQTAPDALFAIGYQLTKTPVRKALESVTRVNGAEVVILDATRPSRIALERWATRVEEFVVALASTTQSNRPGLIVLTDDAGVVYQLRDRLKKRLDKLRSSAPINFRLGALVCCVPGDGLRSVNEAERESPGPKRFKIHIRDKDASKIVGALYKTVQTLSLTPDVAKPIKDAAGFLHKLSSLPSSQAVVNSWLDERDADIRFRDQFSWTSYRARVVEFAAAGHAGPHKGDLLKAVKTADALVAHYDAGTTLAHAVARAAEEPAGDRVRIVFTRPILRLLASRFLERYTFASGESWLDIANRVELLLTSDLERHLRAGETGRYVFVGVDDIVLVLLASDNRIPDGSQILMTYRAGLYMRWMLKPVLTFPAYERFKPRITMMLDQLAQQIGVDPHSVLQQDDFVLPSFNFSLPRSAVSSDRDDEGSVRIELDDVPTIVRGEHSIGYVYDPAHEAAGATGFRSVEIGGVREGDHLFQLSEDLRELLEDVLRRAGIAISHDTPFESTLRQYHEHVIRCLRERFPQKTKTGQLEAIRERIAALHPEIVDLPDNISRWVSLGESLGTPFDELRPQAPRQFAHFKAFADALGFDQTSITWFWQSAIHPIRVNRRVDGRYVGDVYAKILFDPESAIVHSGLSRDDTDSLYQLARENVHTVLTVQRCDAPINQVRS
jgi:hypothetical protein